MSGLSSKLILVGVSGGIAAYKSCDLVRRLRDHGADVKVVMTSAACQFITPMTLQALSGNPVHTTLFDLEQESKINHIALADMPDLIVIAPATADLIAKVAHGLCDDLLTTLLCATTRPVVFCPSMNVNMWSNEATQKNIASLRDRGLDVMDPGVGSLACGYEGTGRLPEVDEIVKYLEEYFKPGALEGFKVLITAGPTWEPIDAVRHITSPSSGKTGYALADEATYRGASVTLVSGPTELPDPPGTEVVRVKTAEEMAKSTFDNFSKADIVIATAAVSDFRPKKAVSRKEKKDQLSLQIELARNEDILARLGKEKKKGQILVGFAAETDQVEQEALRKLKEKNLDLICANDISRPELGFGSDQNQITLFWSGGRSQELPIMSKFKLSSKILDAVEEILREKGKIGPSKNSNLH
jgi:phosphopantothenoylcysteine decarboxylase/phosphopantothenate--cysteine ligase